MAGMRISESGVGCGVCGEVVYASPFITIRNHDITRLPDGRCRWYSRDFEAVVHMCELTSIEAAIEAASGLVLWYLKRCGAIPAR